MGKQRLVIAGLIALFAAGALSAATPAFEAASIKLNQNCGGPGRGSSGAAFPGRLTLECAQLRDLVLTAYGIYMNGGTPNPRSFRMEVRGGPGWVDTDRYDIVAKAEGNPPVAQLYGTMLRALLEDRFALKVHRETKEAPVYFLTVAKGGPKLRRAMDGGTMESLSIQLAMRLDRDVIDKTGITGMFDIHLDVSRSDQQLRAVAGSRLEQADPSTPLLPDNSAGPSIFTALQQQFGLKLESARGPVEILVIDQIETPSPN